jgi:hypothetical protein
MAAAEGRVGLLDKAVLPVLTARFGLLLGLPLRELLRCVADCNEGRIGDDSREGLGVLAREVGAVVFGDIFLASSAVLPSRPSPAEDPTLVPGVGLCGRELFRSLEDDMLRISDC